MSLARLRLSPSEYLDLERSAERKSEFLDGQMFAMAGASENHNLLVANVLGELRNQCKGRSCRVYPSDMRVKVSASGLYTYPDAVALCGEPSFEDERRDTLLNPALLVEVLSPSTEAYDRGVKFGHYRRLGSVSDYLMISQDRMRMEHYVRQGDLGWLLREYSGKEEVVRFEGLVCELRLADVYDKVTLPVEDGE